MEDRRTVERPRPMALCLHGIPLFMMEDLDYFYKEKSITYIVTHLSPRFDVKHKYFWVHPETGMLESFRTHGGALAAYDAVYHADFTHPRD